MWGFIGFLAGLLLVVYLPLWLLDRRHEKKVDREIREKEVREAHALPGLLEPLLKAGWEFRPSRLGEGAVSLDRARW